MGIAALEALNVGIPVVAIESHGVAEILPMAWRAHCEHDVVAVLSGWLDGEWPSVAQCHSIVSRFSAAGLAGRIDHAIRHLW